MSDSDSSHHIFFTPPAGSEGIDWWKEYSGPNTFRYILKPEKREMERRKHEEFCRKEIEKIKIDPIEHYCYRIRRQIPPYKETFEDEDARLAKSSTFDRRMLDVKREEIAFMKFKPEGMTNKEWIDEKRKRRQLRAELNKQNEADKKLENTSPFYVLCHRIVDIQCFCKVEQMRQGIYCPTCRLLKRVDEYLLSLFKDAAEGRSSIT